MIPLARDFKYIITQGIQLLFLIIACLEIFPVLSYIHKFYKYLPSQKYIGVRTQFTKN